MNPNRHSITYNGGTKLSGTESKFGETSAFFDGSNDYLSIPDSADWDFGTGAFTIDFWGRKPSIGSSESVIAHGGFGHTADTNGWTILWNSAGLYFYVRDGSGINSTGLFTTTIDTWYHLALVRESNGDLHFFANGIELTISGVSNLTNDLGLNSLDLRIGSNWEGGNNFIGYIDELRISKGIARWTAGFTPPTSIYTTDSYTKLLLHMEGDDSGQKHEITTVGTPIESVVGKFDGAWEFNGSTDYLTIPNHTDLDLSSGNYTIDCWFYVTAFNDSVILQKDGVYGSEFSSYYVGVTNSTTKKLTCATGRGTSTGGTSYTGTTTLSTGIWYHAAMVVENTTVSLYLNGQLEASGTKYSPITNDSDDLTIGFIPNGPSSYHFNGKIDELRISKGIARWTSNFIPPNRPYPEEYLVDPYTVLLAHSDGDESDSNHNITYNGGVKLSSDQSMFGETSAYFDGTDDYLELPDSADWDLGSTFTIDFWVYHSAVSGIYQSYISNRNSTDTNNWWFIRKNSDGKIAISFQVSGSGTFSATTTSSSPITVSQWTHVAFTMDSGTPALYIDGVPEALTIGTAYSAAPTSSNPLTIGGNPYLTNEYLYGYMDEPRISKNIVRWASGFTPETTPYESDVNTHLLLHFEGDESGQKHELTMVGTPIENATGKFNGAWEFNGTTDYLSFADSTDWDFGTNDFTVDFWMNTTNKTVQLNSRCTVTNGAGLGTTFAIRIHEVSGAMLFVIGGSGINGTIAVDDGNWHHVALVRSGTTAVLYIDGVLDVSSTNSINIAGTLLRIGNDSNNQGHWDGKIDELRISKGIARWTSNFTPPTSPYV